MGVLELEVQFVTIGKFAVWKKELENLQYGKKILLLLCSCENYNEFNSPLVQNHKCQKLSQKTKAKMSLCNGSAPLVELDSC